MSDMNDNDTDNDTNNNLKKLKKCFTKIMNISIPSDDDMSDTSESDDDISDICESDYID